MIDLATYTDTDLDDLRLAVLNEQERRSRLADAPAQVAQTAARYVEDGGNPADLVAVLEGISTPADLVAVLEGISTPVEGGAA